MNSSIQKLLTSIFHQFKYYIKRIRTKNLKDLFISFRNKRIFANNSSSSLLDHKDCLNFYTLKDEVPTNKNDKKDSQLPKVSIIVLTYNNLNINKICLHSIYRNTLYPNFEVIVVDNDSKDSTPKWLKRFSDSHSNMRLILNSKNVGFAAGNNQGAHIAEGEYLIFLNNDTIVTKGWIEKLLAHMRKDPSIGLIGPVTNSTGNEARVPVNYQSPADMEKYASKRAKVMAGRHFDIRMLAFYCVMARKSQFMKIGMLDERYGIGMFEDDDLSVRYHQKGMRVVCAEDVFIHHFQGASFGKFVTQKYLQLFEENKKKYEEKWGKKWEPYQFRRDPLVSYKENDISKSMQSNETISFRCNICGRECESLVAELDREEVSCQCGSTVRSRAIIHLLSMELFGVSIALPDFPTRPDLYGWGMSDGGYADPLAKKINYVNTFYHKQPFLDIAAPIQPSNENKLDFLISTEVFEHVAPPISRAFINARKLIKPTGFFLFTVPYTLNHKTLEHFPELYDYELIGLDNNKPVLINTTIDGQKQRFESLVFHGGPGETLEMRVFTKNGLLSELHNAGFHSISFFSEPYWEYGISFQKPWSLPLIAR